MQQIYSEVWLDELAQLLHHVRFHSPYYTYQVKAS